MIIVALLLYCSSSSSSSSSFSWCFSCFIFCFVTLVTSGFSLLTSRKLMTAQSQFGTYWIGENGDSRPQCLLTYSFDSCAEKLPDRDWEIACMVLSDLNRFLWLITTLTMDIALAIVILIFNQSTWFCRVHFSNIWYYALLSKKKIIKSRANSGDFIIWLILHENPCFSFVLVNIITSSGHVSWGRLVHSFHQCLLIPTDITKDNLQRF